jgi:DNA-binding response OmpR family regulator
MTENTCILLTEDDLNLGQLLQEYLVAKGFVVEWAKNGEEGLSFFSKKKFDVCILDVMMPKKDGFTLAKEIRLKNKQIPLIFLTAKSLKEDTITGLQLGADDYITKPFSMEELLLRIKGILRRIQHNQDQAAEIQVFTIGKYTFDVATQSLKTQDKTQKLTGKETELLRLLSLNLNQTLDRSLALKLIWQDDSYFNARSMDVYITKLRKYLKDDPKLEIINIHGIGYRLQVMN